MSIVKSVVTVFLSISYIMFIGAISFEVYFLDGTKVRYNGWLI